MSVQINVHSDPELSYDPKEVKRAITRNALGTTPLAANQPRVPFEVFNVMTKAVVSRNKTMREAREYVIHHGRERFGYRRQQS